MFFSKSIAFDEEDLGNVAAAAQPNSVRSAVEAEFIERLRAGEAEAFDLLVTRYSADVYALLYRLTGNADEAGDLTQDTFLRAFRSVGKFRGEAELKTWLFRIGINESRNRFRWWKRRKRDSTVSLDDSTDGDRSLHDTLQGNGVSPEESAIRSERQAALAAALSELPVVYKEVIVLCDVENQSYDEIAAALGIAVGTVKSRIARGREELRRKLRDF